MTTSTTPTYHPAPWMRVALLELGVAERPGAANAHRIITYHASTSLKATSDSVAWCSAYVCWVLESTGIKSTKSAAARSFIGWGRALNEPTYGAIVVFRRDAAGPTAGHVGFFVDAPSVGMISVLGGNQDDQVKVKNYPAADLLDVRWP